MIKEYFVNETIFITAQTLGFKDGDKFNIDLIFLKDFNNKKYKIDQKNNSFVLDQDSIVEYIKDTVNVEKDYIEYDFSIEDKVGKDKQNEVNYILAWIDVDGDRIREYDEALIIKINHRLSKKSLRMGIFFDGTGNDISNEKLKENSVSNVRKLFKVYANQLIETSEKQRIEDEEYKKKNKRDIERDRVIITNKDIFPQTMCAYVRGVGSISSMQEEDSRTGAAFGSGGIDRIKGMLYYINTAIQEYVKEYEKKESIRYYPVSLEFDIFGFSRGAALARHFVNLLKQHGIEFDNELSYKPYKIKVRTLNIFDTVASFGMPGNDMNLGYAMHINPNWIEDKIHHFIADDEYRTNFPAHLISNNDTNYPIDLIEDKIEELVLLGAHSDIGGGYPEAKLEHNVANNELSKYYLNEMYNRCKSIIGLSLHDIPTNDDSTKNNNNTIPEDYDLLNDTSTKATSNNDIPEKHNWEYSKEVKNMIDDFTDLYEKYPKLKVTHKKLRERQAYISDEEIKNKIEEIKNKGGVGNIYSKEIDKDLQDLKDERYIFSKIDLDKLELEIDEIANIFNSKNKALEFVKNSNIFHDKYIHISYEKSIGMSPRVKKGIYHREYYKTKFNKIDKKDAKIFYSKTNIIEDKNQIV